MHCDHEHSVSTSDGSTFVRQTAFPRPNYLLRENFLNEFRSEVDKAKVRSHLGIPDEFDLSWGNIRGTIENQKDLINLINTLIDQKLNGN